MIPLVGIGAAAALGVAGWIGYQAGGSGEYERGYTAGAAAEVNVCEAAKRLISATSHNEAERVLRESKEKNDAIERERAKTQADTRVELASNEVRRLRDTDALFERLRAAEAAAAAEGRDRLPDSPGPMPRASGATGRSDADGRSPPWLLPAGGADHLVRTLAEAEEVRGKLAACKRPFPVPPVKAKPSSQVILRGSAGEG